MRVRNVQYLVFVSYHVLNHLNNNGTTFRYHLDCRRIQLLSLYSTATQNHSRWVLASPNAKDSTFALPKAKNTNMLVSLALDDANFSRHLM